MLFDFYVFIFGLLPAAVTGFFLIGGRGHHRAAIAWLVELNETVALTAGHGISQTVSSMPGTPTTDPTLGRALCALTGQLPPTGSIVAR